MTGPDPVERLDRAQIQSRADLIARELGTTREDAFARLERGELSGTIAEPELRMLRDMLGHEVVSVDLARPGADDSEELLPFDGTCPACTGQSDPGERFDGEDFRCGNCGIRLVAVAYAHEMACHVVDRGAVDERTGRQRTRDRWSRRGRR